MNIHHILIKLILKGYQNLFDKDVESPYLCILNQSKMAKVSKVTKSKTVVKSYQTKKVGSKNMMICQNSSTDSKFFQIDPCNEWVSVSTDIASVLCSKCVSKMSGMPQKKSRKSK